jgi:hypothetical protein
MAYQNYWRASFLAILSILGPGCTSRDDLIVWQTELRSPDGDWLASADTIQNGGFGNAEIHTTVFLRGRNAKIPPQEVFVIECDGPIPHPYKLDNVANKGGCVGLTMTWLAPNRLHLSYEPKHGSEVILQVVKLSNVEITVEPRTGLTSGSEATIEIRISSNGCSVGGSEVPCGEVGAKLKAMGVLAGSQVNVRADQDPNYDQSRAAFDSLAKAGYAFKRGLITE